MDVHGNIAGIKNTVLEQLDSLYEIEIAEDEFLPVELTLSLWRISREIDREIGVYITRGGEIVDIIIGNKDNINLPDISLRRNKKRLSAVRCVHTHPNGGAGLSQVDISALKTMRFDAMIAIGKGHKEDNPFVAVGILREEEKLFVEHFGAFPYDNIPEKILIETILQADKEIGRQEGFEVGEEIERAILVGIESQESLEELQSLAHTAGAQVVEMLLQRRDKPDTLTFLGKGKTEELSLKMQMQEADLLIVDDELTGVQIKNLESQLGAKVVDRTALILDIFAQRAKSKEGKLQVELAQLTYQSGRLIGQGLVLSRLAGGIGTRGPGESKLEVNRRRIRERMTEVRRQLKLMEGQRDLRRKSRQKNNIPVVALVGYTNTGKSTLLNAITDAGVFVEDKLFATLDAVGRKVERKRKSSFILVDTVGFIRKLPHTLVKAFHSTLEEATLADILCIVSDSSSPRVYEEHETVLEVLEELEATEQPRIEVLNKKDKANQMPDIYGAIAVSGKTGEGLEKLLDEIENIILGGKKEMTLLLPFDKYNLVGELRKLGQILSEKHDERGSEFIVNIKKQDVEKALAKFGEFLVLENKSKN